MTKDEAQQFKARWKLVNDFTEEESRRTPLAVKLSQFALLYEAAEAFGWTDMLREGEAEVRARWLRLKELHRVRVESTPDV